VPWLFFYLGYLFKIRVSARTRSAPLHLCG
jgi:hypothetical protein